MPRTASSTARQPPQVQHEEPVTVLVTGFGPFLERYPRNSSWDIASTLPALIPATKSNPTPIHIHVLHEPVRVAYNTVLDLIPHLLPPGSHQHPAPSIILHIGLAASRTFFTLEQGAHRRGYGRIPDVDGEHFPDSDAEAKFPSELYPPVLHTSFDTADALARWRANLSHPSSSPSPASSPPSLVAEEGFPNVRLSPDAGNFMCGFIYWGSLAHFFERGEGKSVAFLHVPDLSGSEEATALGREVTVALIKALVESRRVVGLQNDNAGKGKGVEGKEEGKKAGMDVNFA